MDGVKVAITRRSPWQCGIGSLAVAALLFALPLAAQPSISVYRCVDAGGRVALQDQPCPADHQQRRRDVASAPDSPPPALPPAAAETAPEAEDAMPAPAPPPPPPPLWQCVDFEGKARYAEFDDRRPRFVPGWVLGYHGGGPRNVGGSLGRLLPRNPPPPGAASRPIPQIYVEDVCQPLDAASACRVYRERRDAAERLRYTRTGDERTTLDAEVARLEPMLRESCS